MQTFERTRNARAQLESQISALESQHKLVQMASVGSGVQIDHSKLAQTEKLISQIKKQLDVAERVLAHKAKFVDSIPVEPTVNEKDLLSEVDSYLSSPKNASTTEEAKSGNDRHDPEAVSRADRN